MGLHHGVLIALLMGLAEATLSQHQTNGNSVLGTSASPDLPKFLCNNPLPHGYPWGTLTANTSDAYKTHPTTGVIRTYDFTISRGILAPDGYPKSMLLVNGGFPGPLIEANWGDTIQVTVHNNISDSEEGTALHWHGFLQQGTPWEDGAPAVTQCPIAPGASFTYQFQATLYGTSWYHSHYSAQYSDGIVGPIVVYGPNEYSYDIDIGPVMLSDHYHDDYMVILEKMLAPGGMLEVTSDNNLIQGKNSLGCVTQRADDKTPCVADAPQASFYFEKGKVHRLRLINSGSEGAQHFSIDGHMLTVIAYDFVPIVAYEAKVITLGVGQRADILVTANITNGTSFWMRSDIATCATAKQPFAEAAVYYVDSGTTSAQNGLGASSTVWVAPERSGTHEVCSAPERLRPGAWRGRGAAPGGFGHNLSLHGSVSGKPVEIAGSESRHGSHPTDATADRSKSVESTKSDSGTRTGPNSSLPQPSSSPWPTGTVGVPDPSACFNDDLSITRPLYPIALPPPSWTHTFDIEIFVNASDVTLWKFDGVSFRGDYNAPTLLLASLGNTTWPTEWNGRNLYTNTSVRMIVNNPGPSQHPMHLHGSNFYVLHEGPGPWDGTIVRPENPMRRDVQIVRPNGHVVLQFDSNNPGVWLFHCHIAWHASGGFLEQFIVRPDEIERMKVPSIMAQTCRDWAAWTGTHVPDQIDSGL
ncbi:hypothetical protein SEPCBS119000_004690 [Sporothrix epigloea]|uniref:Uncharacterized protein n=1 Tax=Sporothrix epigloea TaxID=1892477 RepID=A0ABP0DVN8_9PEZI